MRRIHLHGSLKTHGEFYDLEVLTAGEAIAALCANIPDFKKDIRDGSWVILRGDPETGICLDEEAVIGMRLGKADLHIMPEISGAKNSTGILKAIIGVTLIVASGGTAGFLAAPISGTMLGGATWGAALGQIGLAMTLGGVASLLAPEQQSQSDEDKDKSYTLTGPVSSTGQGAAIQIVYGGPIITGGMMISGGIDTDGLDSITEAPEETIDPDDVENEPENIQLGGGL